MRYFVPRNWKLDSQAYRRHALKTGPFYLPFGFAGCMAGPCQKSPKALSAYLCSLILMLALAGPANARTFLMDEGFSSTDLQGELEVFVDTSGQLKVEQIERASFQPVGDEVWNRGLSSSNHWLKFSIKNGTDLGDPVYLEVF